MKPPQSTRLDCEKSGRTWNIQRNSKTANALRDSEHFNLQFLHTKKTLLQPYQPYNNLVQGCYNFVQGCYKVVTYLTWLYQVDTECTRL